VSRYQKGKTNLDFTEARDSEWQWHQLGHMQVCTSLQTDNYASTTPLSFLQAGCPSCHPTNSIKHCVRRINCIVFITDVGIVNAVCCCQMSVIRAVFLFEADLTMVSYIRIFATMVSRCKSVEQ